MTARMPLVVLVAAAWVAGTCDAAAPTAVEAFFEKHCYDCHSGTKPEAGLDLAVVSRDFSDPDVLKKFVRIHDRVAAGEMPPADAAQPARAEFEAFTGWLDEELLRADTARITAAGRTRMRRMTAAEYENTLRDLLALDRLEIRSLLPEDGRVAGYNKIADGLDLSPVHLEAYTRAAELALDAAIATRSTPPPVFKRRFYPAGVRVFFGQLIDEYGVLLKDKQWDNTQPLEQSVEPEPPGLDHDGKYARKQNLRAAKKQACIDLKIPESTDAVGLLGHLSQGVGGAVDMGVAPIYAGPYRLRFSLWGFQWNKGQVEPIADLQYALVWAANDPSTSLGRPLDVMVAPSLESREHEFTTWLDPREQLIFDPISVHSRFLGDFKVGGGVTRDYQGAGVAIDWFEVEGPVFASWPPESHRRLFGDLPIEALPPGGPAVPPRRVATPTQSSTCVPVPPRDFPKEEQKRPLETVQSSDPAADARLLLAEFLPRALRRPVSSEMVDAYVALVQGRLAANECFEDAMRRAYVAVLTSPDFLFHQGDGGCDAFAIASRLSYWLWNSAPDAALLADAASGALADSKVLHAQIDRLLADPRGDRFLADFTDQWLELSRIDETQPDRDLYPEFSPPLQWDMVAETRAFIRELIANDLPVRTLVDANFAMLTQRLATHYGIPKVEGVEVRRVALPVDAHRGGLLTQASILKLTANGSVTSPVKRGIWVMDRLLGEPPQPPPQGVPAVDPDTRGATTIREQLAKHRSDTSCAVCHKKIDPPGFALESFDPIGGYRDRYRSTSRGDPVSEEVAKRWRARYRIGPAVDASGQLADGRSYRGIDDLRKLLAADERGLARAFTGHMVRYATGADLTYADRRTIDGIVESTVASGYGVRSLIHAIAASSLVTGGCRMAAMNK
jgi:mono/diheme cytochrome c family protein